MLQMELNTQLTNVDLRQGIAAGSRRFELVILPVPSTIFQTHDQCIGSVNQNRFDDNTLTIE